MMDRSIPICWGLVSLISALGMTDEDRGVRLLLGGIAGLGGLLVARRLRTWLAPSSALLTAVALSASLVWSSPGESSLRGALTFLLSCAAFYLLGASPRSRFVAGLLVLPLAIAPSAWDGLHGTWTSIHPDNLFVALFGGQGLLYQGPLLWAGLAGLAGLHRSRPDLVVMAVTALLPGAAGLCVASDHGETAARALSFVPFLAPGLGWSIEGLRAYSRRRPERVVGMGGAALVLWNLLFMEQYRTRLVPSDDTVSFAQVTANSADLLAAVAGSPTAWPANWIFAKRFHAPPARWDAVAGRRLFSRGAKSTTIEVGDDASPFAADSALLLEGFGTRRTCARGWCRDLRGDARLLLPLDDTGRGDLVLRLRVRGEGALQVTFNDAATSVTDMSPELSDISLRIPGRLISPGISLLSLKPLGGGQATLDRFSLERDPGPGSAR